MFSRSFSLCGTQISSSIIVLLSFFINYQLCCFKRTYRRFIFVPGKCPLHVTCSAYTANKSKSLQPYWSHPGFLLSLIRCSSEGSFMKIRTQCVPFLSDSYGNQVAFFVLDVLCQLLDCKLQLKVNAIILCDALNNRSFQGRLQARTHSGTRQEPLWTNPLRQNFR